MSEPRLERAARQLGEALKADGEKRGAWVDISELDYACFDGRFDLIEVVRSLFGNVYLPPRERDGL